MAKRRGGKRIRSRVLPILGGLGLTIVVLMVQEFDHGLLKAFRDRLDWLIYDVRLNSTLTGDPPSRPDITIIDIDEASLRAEGQWPWPRARIADLVDRLVEYGVIVTSFDVVFAEAEENFARHALREITPHLSPEARPVASGLLEQAADLVDGDRRLVESIRNARDNGMDVASMSLGGGFSQTVRSPLGAVRSRSSSFPARTSASVMTAAK